MACGCDRSQSNGNAIMPDEEVRCQDCQGEMTPWQAPEESSWGGAVQLVCFNDDCPYFKNGWQWMKDQFNMTASYRNRYNPKSKKFRPLPVWSHSAHRDAVIED